MVRLGRRALQWASLATLTSPGLAAQSRDWSPEDRAVIGDFSRISAVAVSRERVFAVTPASVLAWDPLGHRWEGPWRPPDPSQLLDVSQALADPLDGGLWLVRRGGWLRFDPGIRLWEQGTVPGSVIDAALDENAPAAGLFLRTSAAWYVAQRGGITLQGSPPRRPVRPQTVNEAVRSNPAISANSAALLFNNRLRSVRYTAAARAQGFGGQGWFLGTSGAGLVFLPDGAGIPEMLTFGLPSDAADAVFAGTGGVWVVTERTPTTDPGVSFVSSKLDSFTWLRGPRATGLPFAQARRIVGRESDLWIATDAGVVRMTPRSDDYVRYDDGRGLPDPRVLDLAQRRGRIVAGTAHGLASFSDSTVFQRLAPNFSDAALAVAIGGDTVWVGTRLGLFASVPGEADLLQPDALRQSVAMQAAVVDITWRADTLVALLQDRLLWRDPTTGVFALGPLLGNALGRLHTIANGHGGLYLAGEQGVGFASLTTPLRRPFTVADAVPGRVTDIAVDDDYLWVATLQGLVRFRLDIVGQ